MAEIIKYGEQAEKHSVMPGYKNWGRVGSLKFNSTNDELPNSLNALLKIIGFSTELFELVSTRNVEYYQGENLSIRKAVLLRFAPKGEDFSKLGGEHFSIIIDSKTEEILGFTKMLKYLDGNSFVTHQEAFDAVLKFLTEAAPDLVSAIEAEEDKKIKINQLPNGSRMIFPNPIIIDHVQVNWIDRHDEKISDGSQEIIISGMKVKMFLPDTNLWAWVIVDKYGDVQTFERNISWDFDKMQRKTQMWLHDQWLLENNINF